MGVCVRAEHREVYAIVYQIPKWKATMVFEQEACTLLQHSGNVHRQFLRFDGKN